MTQLLGYEQVTAEGIFDRPNGLSLNPIKKREALHCRVGLNFVHEAMGRCKKASDVERKTSFACRMRGEVLNEETKSEEFMVKRK